MSRHGCPKRSLPDTASAPHISFPLALCSSVNTSGWSKTERLDVWCVCVLPYQCGRLTALLRSREAAEDGRGASRGWRRCGCYASVPCLPRSTRAAPAQFSDKDSVQELLPLFYDRLFPASDMYRCALGWARRVDEARAVVTRALAGGLPTGTTAPLPTRTKPSSRRELACPPQSRQPDPAHAQRREFCFTLENDIFVRYQSFKDGAELRAAICKRCARIHMQGKRAR